MVATSWPVLTFLALGRGPIPEKHGYRPRKGASLPEKPPPPLVVHLQVCLSPGCIADGAQATLEKMQALAPAHVIVEAGACVSFCGSGPVVQESNDEVKGPLKHKNIQDNEKILNLLYPSGNVPSELIEGFNIVQRGDDAFENEKHEEAVKLYESAVNIAFRSAVELENERDLVFKYEQQQQISNVNGNGSKGTSSRLSTRVPKGLEWLIRARRNEASCKLKLKDIDGAMLAAQASCNLSRNTSAESFLVLAEIYREEGGLVGENQALEKALSLWSDESKLSFAQKNQRRLATIRNQKVQREISLAKQKVNSDDVMSLQEAPAELKPQNGSSEEAQEQERSEGNKSSNEKSLPK